MGKALKIAAIVVGVAALVVTGAGIVVAVAGGISLAAGAAAVTAAIGISAAMLSAAAAVLSLGASLLAPRPKNPGISRATLDRLNVTLDPRTARKAILGDTALATDLRDHEVIAVAGTKDNQYVHRFIVCAAHKLTSIEQLWFDDELVWTSSGGATGSAYGYLTVTAVLEGNAGNAINISGRLGASRRFTGCAYIHLRYLLSDKSPYTGSIPSRMTIRGLGMPTYDPRKDTTAGGSGSQRANDQSTWTYDSGGNFQGGNPACQLLTWLLGWKIQNPVTSEWKLSVGKGIPADRINMASFITAANACDETVSIAAGGTEKRYVSAAIVSEAEDPLGVVDRFKGAMNATLDDVDGQLRLTVLVNDLGAPVADFTENDIIDEFSWRPSENLAANFNIIRGTYVDPSNDSLFQMVEYPEVVLPSRDEIDRIESIDYSFVQNFRQAQRLSKQRLQRAQYPGVFQALYQVTGWKVQKGDVVRQTFGPVGFTNKLFRVVELEHRADGLVPLTLREENAAIYAWDSSEEGEVNFADPVAYSLSDTPWQKLISGQWIPPSATARDANLLTDDMFGSQWTKTAGFVRVDGAASGSAFPIASSKPYVGEVALGGGSARSATTAEAVKVTPGRTLHIRYRLSRSVGSTGTANINLTGTFKTKTGSTVAGGPSNTLALSSVTADGVYYERLLTVTVPATADTLADFKIEVATNAATGTVRIEEPWISDKEPGANVTTAVVGATPVIIKYESDGTTAKAGQLTRTEGYKLLRNGVDVTGDATWSRTVLSGTVTSTIGASTGSLSITALGSLEAKVRVSATYQNQTNDHDVLIRKEVDPATTGGGGGGGGTNATDYSFANTTAITHAAISDELTIVIDSSTTQARLIANLQPIKQANDMTGDFAVFAKAQWWDGAAWQDVAAETASSPHPYNEMDGEGIIYRYAGQVSFNITKTGLTGGSSHKFRLMARNHNFTDTMNWSGSFQAKGDGS